MARKLPETARLLLRELHFARQTTIVDVGANPINPTPYSALLRAGACQLVGFEPQAEAFAELQKQRGGNERYFPHAVGDGSKVTLRLYRNSGFTSVFRPDVAAMGLVGGKGWPVVLGEVEFDTVALDAIPDLPVFDLLKIDIQGGETMVFAGGERVLGQALSVIVELRYQRLYQGEPMLGGVDCELRRQGFTLHKFLFSKSGMLANSQAHRLHRRKLREQLIDGDAVYIRDLTRLDTLEDDQLRHFALLAAAVFHSHSLVLHLLDELERRRAEAPGLAAAYVDLMPPELLVENRASV